MGYSGTAVFGGTTDPVTGSWNNATALNSTVVSSDITGYGVVAASFVITGTITQGTAIFEVSDDAGATWWPISGLQTGNNNQTSSFALTGSSSSFEFATGAYNLFRVRLNPVILGSGSVAIRLSAEAFPFLTAVAITGTTNVSITGTNAVTVSGTVLENLAQLNGVALGSPSNFGTSPGAVVVAGTNSSIFAGTTALTATGSSLNVNITGGSSSGTQYTGSPAVAAGSLVSNLMSAYDGANVRPVSSDSSGQVKVLVQNTPSVAQSGTWTVQQGTPPWSVSQSGSWTVAVSGTVAVTQSTSPWVVSLASTTITGTVAVTQSTSPWTIQGDSASGASNAGNPVKVGGAFNTTQPTVTNGQTVDAQMTARGAQIVSTGVDTFNVTVNTALPAGTNVIGHVITDSGSTTVVTGTVAVTQSTSPWVVSLASTTITGTVAVTQSTSPWTIQGDSASGAAKAGNPVQIGGVFNTTQPTVTTGQTVEAQSTARGAQIVATGVDTFNVTVNAALPAGTNVIGHVITDSGSTTAITGTVAVTQSTSPWVTNNTQWASTTLGTPQTFGTAPTGVVIGTSSDIYVAGTRARSNQTTTAAGVLDVNNVGIDGVTIVTAAAGVQKVGVVGNAGAAFDTPSTQNQAMPANMVVVGGEYNTTPTTITTGNASPLQLDSVGSVKGTTPDRSVAISLTAVGQTAQISLEGRASMGFNISNIGTGGQLVVEGSIDGSNWFGIDIWSEFNETWIINPATVSSVGNWWAEPVGAMQAIRVRVTALTSGTITGTMLADNFYMGTFEFQASDGSTYPNNLIAVGGQGIDGNVHGLRTDSQGNLQVAVTPATSGTFTTFGDITTAVIAKVVVRETTYNEQAANAIRSISSSSANDTAAGTGARTVKINFMTLAGVTGSETITLNGTTAVATTNSFAYIESIIVLTVGTGGSNAGTLTVFVNNAGGGGTFATIAAGTNRSFWAHHYVATGKICRITGVCVGHNGTTTGSGGLFSLAAITLNASNQPEVQISDFVRLYGQSSTVTRNYGSPITVTGPARIVHYVTPETSTSTNYKAAFDFFEG